MGLGQQKVTHLPIKNSDRSDQIRNPRRGKKSRQVGENYSIPKGAEQLVALRFRTRFMQE